MSPSQHQPHHESSFNSFVTGAIVGALAALTLGTEEGRRVSQNLIATLKSLSEEFISKSGNPLPQKVSEYQQEFKQSVQELNTNLQNTSQQIIDRLHRPSNPPQYPPTDGPTFS